MIGGIIGDIIGSRFEQHNCKRVDFELFDDHCRFTDDTVLTAATADALLHDCDFAQAYKQWYERYPGRGYGPLFRKWAGHWRRSGEKPPPYHSFGNGSAMRVAPIAWVFDSLDQVLVMAKRSAEVTHNHPEGIKGAMAVAGAVFLARTGESKEAIRAFVRERFRYALDRSCDEIRPGYRFDSTCPGSVPEAITAFLESSDFEDAIRKAVSLGGDSDTIACMTGSIAEAYYRHIPVSIVARARSMLDARIIQVVGLFTDKYGALGCEPS